MKRTSWRLLLVVGAVVLGALLGAYVAGQKATACVDRTDGNSTCTDQVAWSVPGAVVGALLAGALTACATRGWSRD